MRLRLHTWRLSWSAEGFWVGVGLLACGLLVSAAAQSPPQTTHKPKSASTATRSTGQKQLSGIITGTVIDHSGAVAVGAKVQLTRADDQNQKSNVSEVVSGENGDFSFSNLPPGPFHISVTAPGFDPGSYSGELTAGQAFLVPPIMLNVATAVTTVKVAVDTVEVAEEQIKQQEQQRVFGIIPNFYVSYVPDAAPLVPRQKFQLAWRSVIDPVTLLGVGFLAGIDQAADEYHGYGQGAAGYARRFGAEYGDVVAGTFIGSAILPSLLKQDPRYFYQGTGTKKSRLKHALLNSVVAKGDNKQWQPNYSGILGSFAAGGISYLYYPAGDRSASLFVQNSFIRIGESSVAGLIQEFVLRKFTSHVPPSPDSLTHP